MGLTIVAYSDIELQREGGPEPAHHWPEEFSEDNHCHLQGEPQFPQHHEGLASGVYSFRCTKEYSVGPYSVYNEFRKSLGRLVGHPVEQAPTIPEVPFGHLLTFADSSGVIGPKGAARLHEEFEAHQDKASSALSAPQFEIYQGFQDALYWAAQDGCLSFN